MQLKYQNRLALGIWFVLAALYSYFAMPRAFRDDEPKSVPAGMNAAAAASVASNEKMAITTMIFMGALFIYLLGPIVTFWALEAFYYDRLTSKIMTLVEGGTTVEDAAQEVFDTESVGKRAQSEIKKACTSSIIK